MNWTLSDNVENLTLIDGTSAVDGTGNQFNNKLVGNSADNNLSGDSGNDSLYGLTGNDTLLGGAGNDRLVGDLGSDTLTGGRGNDILDLGDGTFTDTVNYASGDGTDRLYGFSRAEGGDNISFTGIDYIDVVEVGTDTQFRVGNGEPETFGTGSVLVTMRGTTGFTNQDVGVNLISNGGQFLFT